MKYLPVELHCHTVHSDGDFLPEQLQAAAAAEGLRLVALTDHNTFSGWREMNEKICPFIRGIEWTTYFGHMLVLGAEKFVDWRDAVPDNIDEKISLVKAANGVVGIAHPFQCGSPVCTGGRWEFNVQNWQNVDYIEIWHEDFSPLNTENGRALDFWTELLDKGYRLAASYGRDWHRPQSPDKHFGCTYLGFENGVNEREALNAVRLGRTVVSSGANFSFRVISNGSAYDIGANVPSGGAEFLFNLNTRERETLTGTNSIEYKTVRIVTNGGKTALETDYKAKSAYLYLEKGHWYRAELHGKINGGEKILAVTSPVYS